MVQVLTDLSAVYCTHGGRVVLAPSQDLVRIAGQPVLVEPDLEGRPIRACPHATPMTPPCTQTVGVSRGPTYSSFVTIEGRAVCKDSAVGRTNWSKLGVVPFLVRDPRQDWIGIGD